MLQVAGLHVRYGAVRAVQGIDVSVGNGEVVALLHLEFAPPLNIDHGLA